MNVAEFAVLVGEEASRHYWKLAAEGRSPRVSRIFTLLAGDQKGRSERLTALESDRSAMRVDTETLDRADRMLFHAFGRAIDYALQSEADAYRHALSNELRLVNLLERLARREINSSAKRALLRLADEERRLYREIAGLRDFTQESRWFPTAIEYVMELDRGTHLP